MLLPLAILGLQTQTQPVPLGANVLGLLFPLDLDISGTIRVQATAIGEYGGDLFDVGDVFDIVPTAFSDSTVDYSQGKAGGPLYGWMKIVPGSTPLTNPTPQIYDWTSKRRTVF